MSFSAYSYENPYGLTQTSFWNEIKRYPHLCSSSVMARSLSLLYHNSLESIICPINDIVDMAYPNWEKDIRLELAQYSAISSAFAEWHKERGPTSDTLYSALKHNQKKFIDALRRFIELDVDIGSLHKDSSNEEQQLFIDVLTRCVSNSDEGLKCFHFEDDFNRAQLPGYFVRQCEMDIEREKKTSDTRIEEQEHIIRGFEALKRQFLSAGIDSIVVHGIHQFKPMQLRFISRLDRIGVHVFFLFNYLPQYRTVYSTWDRLYRYFCSDIQHDRNSIQYSPKRKSTSHDLAISLGQILDGADMTHPAVRDNWIKTVESLRLLEFDNTTEFVGYVSRFFDQALHARPNNPISVMKEQIYSAGGNANDLLRINYPQSAGDRHFLHYPIGQFFVSLYRMWNQERSVVEFIPGNLRTCIASNVLNLPRSGRILDTFQHLEAYYEDITELDGFISRIEVLIQQNILMGASRINQRYRHHRNLAFYEPGTVSVEDLESLRSFMLTIQSLSIHLFKTNQQMAIDFSEHFKKLETFIRANMSNIAETEERTLVESLLDRLTYSRSDIDISGSIDDLQNGLYFYLKQRDIESPDWIVRNFVQIEGDILRSAQQSTVKKDAPVYHFAGLSNRAMTQSADELLPWPLTDSFIRSAYSPNGLLFQVYYTALCDYQDFLRYAFFYGCYFNQCDLKISYIRNIEPELEEEPFGLLTVLGICTKKIEILSNTSPSKPSTFRPTTPADLSASPEGKMDFLLCPYKYYLDQVCSTGIVFDSPFMVRNYYVNLLVGKLWHQKALQRRRSVEASLDQDLRIIQDEYGTLYPFLQKEGDRFDLRLQAKNYILNHLMDAETMKRYDGHHMEIRMKFGKALFVSDKDAFHPYSHFESLITKDEDKRICSLHGIDGNQSTGLMEDTLSYLRNGEYRDSITGEWCRHCVHDWICMKPYIEQR
jgi:hypothetical protein